MPVPYHVHTFEMWSLILDERFTLYLHPLSWGDKTGECWATKGADTSHTRWSCSSFPSEQCLCQCCSCLLFSEVTALWVNPLATVVEQGHVMSFSASISGNGNFHCLLPPLKVLVRPMPKKIPNGTGKVYFWLCGMWSRYDRVLSNGKAAKLLVVWTYFLSIWRFLVNQFLKGNW